MVGPVVIVPLVAAPPGPPMLLVAPEVTSPLVLGQLTVALPGPPTLSLALAVPFCVLTAAPGFSAWLQARGIAATPEELRL